MAKDSRNTSRGDQEPGSKGGPGSPGGRKPNQVPEGDLSKAVGTHKESDFNTSDPSGKDADDTNK